MNIIELLLLCILIIGILLFVISRIRSSPPQQTFVPSSAGVEIMDELAAELRHLLQTNQKIAAIKLYRQETGASLKEAKDAVDSMASGMLASASYSPQQTFVPSSIGEEILDELTFELRRLLQANQKIAAIKLYRETTGASLKEAKDAVDRL